MLTYNKWFGIGNLVKDPELRKTNSGNDVIDMRIAVNHLITDPSTAEKKDDVCFVDLEGFGAKAAACGKYLKKGSRIWIEGRLRQDRWEDQQGNKRSKLMVRIINVIFLDRADIQQDLELETVDFGG